MKEMGLLEYWEGILLFLSNHGFVSPDKRAIALTKLIKEENAYDERIDEIVEHYRRLDSEPSGVDGERLTCDSFGHNVRMNVRMDEEIIRWIDTEIQMIESKLDDDYVYADEAKREIEILKRIKQLLSQKPQDYEQNLTDCTEAIDALIEERDALIEDSKAYDERVDEIVEHYRRQDSEPKVVDEESIARLFHETYERLAPKYGYKTRKETSVDWKDVPQNNKDLMIAVVREIKQLLSQKRGVTREELSDLAYRMKERAEVGSLTLTNYHAVIKWVARELGVEVAE